MEDDAGYESGAGSAAEDGAGPACGEEAMDAEEREDDSPRTQLIKANIRVVGPGLGASGRGPEAGWGPAARAAAGVMSRRQRTGPTGHIRGGAPAHWTLRCSAHASILHTA